MGDILDNAVPAAKKGRYDTGKNTFVRLIAVHQGGARGMRPGGRRASVLKGQIAGHGEALEEAAKSLMENCERRTNKRSRVINSSICQDMKI